MFTISEIDFRTDGLIDCAINDQDFYHARAIDFFDKDGYELTPIEQAYYQASGLKVIKYTANHPGVFQPWITVDHAEVSIDHSCAMLRCGFTGPARDQIHKHTSHTPRFGWLLTCQPKFGLDINIDYCCPDFAVEVIHLESDCDNPDHMHTERDQLEQFVISIDWVDAAHKIWQRRDQWQHLTGWYAQAHWKAKYFGFARPWH